MALQSYKNTNAVSPNASRVCLDLKSATWELEATLLWLEDLAKLKKLAGDQVLLESVPANICFSGTWSPCLQQISREPDPQGPKSVCIRSTGWRHISGQGDSCARLMALVVHTLLLLNSFLRQKFWGDYQLKLMSFLPLLSPFLFFFISSREDDLLSTVA